MLTQIKMNLRIKISEKEAKHFEECYDQLDTCLVYQGILNKIEKEVIKQRKNKK